MLVVGSGASLADPVAVFERHRRAQLAARRRTTALGVLLLASVLAASIIIGKVSPAALVEGVPDIVRYIEGTIPPLTWTDLGGGLRSWYWGLGTWLIQLGDTILVAFLGTLFGGMAGFLLSFPASRNLSRSRLTYFAVRRILEIARTVPDLVYALIFVYAFGLGPLAGMLAIALHSAGSLGKLFAEANENVDPRPLEGVAAAGGNWTQIMAYAVVPQVLPNFASYALLRFEINARGASILGIVGAGGIGQELYLAIRQFEYHDISAIVLLIALMVVLIDLACEQIRHRLIGGEALRAA